MFCEVGSNNGTNQMSNACWYVDLYKVLQLHLKETETKIRISDKYFQRQMQFKLWKVLA